MFLLFACLSTLWERTGVALTDKNALVRRVAINYLINTEFKSAQTALVVATLAAVVKTDADTQNRKIAVTGLEGISLKGCNEEDRIDAKYKITEALEYALFNGREDIEVREETIKALGKKGKKGVRILRLFLELTERRELRLTAVEVLRQMGGKEAQSVLEDLAGEECSCDNLLGCIVNPPDSDPVIAAAARRAMKQ